MMADRSKSSVVGTSQNDTRQYYMPYSIDSLNLMQVHIKDYFPYEDKPNIFGLHPSATVKTERDFANALMMRVY